LGAVMSDDYDVIVVGAGPAGSVAARDAARGGARVLMLEKRQEIGVPVRCGEGIAKRWLDKLGIEPSSSWIANEVDGARIFSPRGNVLVVDERHAGNEAGYVIHRDMFDMTLAKDAVRAGAEVMVKTSVTGLIHDRGKVSGVKASNFGEKREWRCKVLIGADGYESQVGRWAGIDTTLSPSDIDTCYQYTLVGVDVDRRFNDFYVGSLAPGGYIWVFPKGPDVANVGIGHQLSKVTSPGDPKRRLDEFIARHPELSGGHSVRDIAGAVSICAPIDRTVADGVMLIGDAARLIDPITGGGVYHGCLSGSIAAKVALEALEAKDFSAEFFQRYERGWRAELEEKLYRNWMAKEKMATLSDDTFDKAVEAVASVPMEEISVMNILQAIKERYPELIKEFEDLL
jgi:digeranylgeranylglycerophospholipid reductase